MNILTLASLSFGMSMDAFAVAIAKGATNEHPNFIKALKAGLFFGVIEAIAPLIGFALGAVANEWLQNYDHWLAFVMLTILGAKFIYESIKDDEEDKADREENNLLLLTFTAIATSIDSVVVGVSLAFLNVNIFLASLFIGIATTVMATTGLYLGNRLGSRFGKIAMAVGGMVLILIGVSILYSHLAG